jgi:hypothetical protein
MYYLQRMQNRFFAENKVKCSSPEKNIYTDFSAPSPMAPERPSPVKSSVPNYKHVMLMSLKRLTMSGKMFEVPGFKFFYMLPISQRFMIQNEFILNPNKAPSPQNYMQMMMMGQQKDPYFMMSMNYVGGELSSMMTQPAYSISTRVGTHGMVDVIFAKPWKSLMFKLNAIAQKKAGIIHPMFALEVEHEGRFSNQQMVLTGETVELNSFTRLGRRWHLGLELVHAFAQKMTLLGYLAKFRRTPFETYYAQYQDMKGQVTLGSVVRLNKKMSVATELEIDDRGSKATLAMSRKFGKLELNSAIDTEAVIKSNFNIKSGLFTLKLFLNAKMKEEDYNTGIHLSINPMGDMG